LLKLAVGDDVIELGGTAGEGGRIRRRGRGCGHFDGECLVLVVEYVEARIPAGW